MGSRSTLLPDLALTFHRGLQAEVLENRSALDPVQYTDFSRYYRSLRDHTSLYPFYRYNWTRRVTPMLEIVTGLPRRGTPWRVLDAGCGMGTESIFWSTLRSDVEIVGVDIHSERLDVARARQRAYERRLGRSLGLCFLCQDIFQVLRARSFDLVWSMESISHIDPAEGFLRRVSEALDSPGYLVISDSHLCNPAIAWRVWRLRARGIAERTRTMVGEQCLSYAQERLFNVNKLSRLLRSAGFRSIRNQLAVYFPPILARFSPVFRVCMWFDALLSQVPLIRNLGGIYTIVASKS
jgi:SAM-dependent methyltransferase